MTIWIDPPRWPAHGRLWSHLVSDTSTEELHAFADAAGLPRRGFEGDHYDVPQERYAGVVAAGAVETDGRDLLRRLLASGLRIQKRTHEGVVASVSGPGWLPPGSRADVIRSRQAEPPAGTVLVRLAVVADQRLAVVERRGGGLDLPSARLDGRPVADALAGLGAVVGPPAERPALRGYVRNTVPAPTPGYPWPAPRACFCVYVTHAEPDRVAPGTVLLDRGEAARELSARHWWPLFAEGFG